MAWVIAGSRPVRGHPRPIAAATCTPAPSTPLVVAVAAIATISILIAAAFALAGAWLVLPFAGVEIAALAWALRHAARSRAAVAPPPNPACPRRYAASRVRPLSIPVIHQRRKLS